MTLPAAYSDLFIDGLMETGNVSRTAERLGLALSTLYHKRNNEPDFGARWDLALEVSRQGLRDRVVETATAMGLGQWVPVAHPDTGRVLLDDDFDPVLRFDTSHVDARVLMKLLDKTMRDEVKRVDRRTTVDGQVEHVGLSVRVYGADGTLLSADEPIDAEFEEVDDGRIGD